MQAYTMLWMAAEPPTVMQHNSENIALQRSQLFLFFLIARAVSPPHLVTGALQSTRWFMFRWFSVQAGRLLITDVHDLRAVAASSCLHSYAPSNKGNLSSVTVSHDCTPTATEWRRQNSTQRAQTSTMVADHRQHLRSASRLLLVVPRHRLSAYGRRAFAMADPTVWNSLEDNFRDPDVCYFKHLLKTFLFIAYQCN